MSSFWAKRRAAVAAEEAAEAEAMRAAERATIEAELATRDEAELLAELNLPDPDTLGAGDDFKAFLTDAVPARLKTRALRRLWLSNPVLANVDGLVDYGGDFTDAALAVENLQTAYQVGKGMTAHVEELARQAEAEAQAQAQPQAQDDPSAETTDAAPEAAPEVAPGAQPDLSPEEVEAPEPAPKSAPPLTQDRPIEEAPAPIVSRRMRFSFEPTEQTT